MLFCGLWFGESKLLMRTFGRPLLSSLKNLEENGFMVTVNEKEVLCKEFLICTTADLPATCLLMNMNQFNGAFSCSMCLQKGTTRRTCKGGSVHIYPFVPESPLGESRTHHQSIIDASDAIRTSGAVDGIKGPSFLMCLKSLDFIKSSGIYYMHGVLLGVTKLLIK